MAMDMGMGTPPDQTEPTDAPATGGGFTVEISCLPDGTFQVSSEPIAQEAAEETGEPGSEMGETFESIGEALKRVINIIQSGGITDDGQSEFDAGFNGDAPAEEEAPAMQTDPTLRA